MKNAFKLGALSLMIATAIVACDPKKGNSNASGIDTLKVDSLKVDSSKTSETKATETTPAAGGSSTTVDTSANGTVKTKAVDTVANKVIETKTKKNDSKVVVKKVVKE